MVSSSPFPTVVSVRVRPCGGGPVDVVSWHPSHSNFVHVSLAGLGLAVMVEDPLEVRALQHYEAVRSECPVCPQQSIGPFGGAQQVPPRVRDGEDQVERLDGVEVGKAAGDDLHLTGRAGRDPTGLGEVLELWVHPHDPPARDGEWPEEAPRAAPDVEDPQVAAEATGTGEPHQERHLDRWAFAVEGGVAAAVIQRSHCVASFASRGAGGTADPEVRPN